MGEKGATMSMRLNRNACWMMLAILVTSVGCMDRPDFSGSASSKSELSRFVMVTGEGAFAVDPNQALLDLVVENEGATAKVAYALGQQRLTALKLALEQVGVRRPEVEAREYTLEETWSEIEGVLRKSYRMRHSIRVSVRDLVKMPETLDMIATQGTDLIRGVRFGFTNPTAMFERARERALADARARAEVLAEESGQRLGAVWNIVEAPSDSMDGHWLDGDAAASPYTFEVTVNVTYALSDF
jgi:uncharacterized protein YggE